jgi:flagellar hook-associated protein 2
MAAIQLSGLVSGFDWKSFVDTIVDLERTPAKKLQAEIEKNLDKADALDGVGTMLTSLNTAITALNTDGVFDARTASTSGTGWTATAASTAAPGSAAFTVTQLATAAKLTSTNDIGNNIAADSNVSGVSLANLGTGTALTAGVFTVNGARVTVDLGSSLADLFTAIGTATGGKVTASYNATDDKITLANTVEVPANTTPIVLGSSTDTSNFLSITRLANNGGTSISSSVKLGAANPTATLANARLKTPIAGVDGSGNGSFTINGVAIAYNTGTDTLNSVVSRINAAGAGVTAAFDPITDKVSLQNTSTGDLGFSLADTTGTLLSSLGLTSGATLTNGRNAQFSVNGGPTITSMSNTLTADSHGITGLSLTPTSEGTQTVSIAAETTSVRTKIDAFINSFNSVQSFIDTQSKVTSANGKVTTSTLSDNREIQSWGPALRKNIFSAVPGLSSTLSQLSHIGIDFSGTSSLLSIKEPTKLDAALKDRPAEVSAMFRQSSTGIFARLTTLLDSFNGGTLGTGGILAKQKTSLTTSNTSLTTQIADIDRRLVQRRSVLESGFIAMERAQSLIKSMQSQISGITPASAYSSSK